MSRIHDALRLRRVSAGAPHAVRAGQTDAVLSALGYRSEAADDSSPLKPGVALAALAIVVAILAAWYFWPRGSVASLTSTHAPVAVSRTPSPAPPPQAISKPVASSAAAAAPPRIQAPAAKVNRPAQSVSTS